MRTLRRPLLALTAALAAGLFGLAGCSSSSPSSTSTATTAGPATSGSGAGDAVSIKNFAFAPTPLTVKVGATITVTNNDQTDHTFSDSGGAFDTGHIAPGASASVTITKAGTFTYHCKIHTSMTGVIQAA